MVQRISFYTISNDNIIPTISIIDTIDEDPTELPPIFGPVSTIQLLY